MDLDVDWTTSIEIDEEIDARITLNETFKRRESVSIYSAALHAIQSDEASRSSRNRYV